MKLSANTIEALGLFGANAPTRYVGGSYSGAPTTGTWLKGDFVIDSTGQVQICTVAGSPGTWAAAGSTPTNELGYSSLTSTLNSTAVTSMVDTGLTLSAVAAQTKPVYIHCWIAALIANVQYAVPKIQLTDGTNIYTAVEKYDNGVQYVQDQVDLWYRWPISTAIPALKIQWSTGVATASAMSMNKPSVAASGATGPVAFLRAILT
jgi:hypothetical protein